MKKTLVLSILILISTFFVSCASTAEKPIPTDEPAAPAVKTGMQTYEILDWQYKGFGKELPDWVKAFYEGGMTEVRKLYPEYTEDTVNLFQTYSGTLEHSEALFNSFLKKRMEDDSEKRLAQLGEADEDGMLSFTVGEEYRSTELSTTINVSGDICVVKERCWVLLKETYYDSNGDFQNEEISYRSIALIAREDKGL